MQNVYIITGASSDVGVSLINEVYKTDDIYICQGTGNMQGIEALAQGKSNINIYDVDLTKDASIDAFVTEITTNYPTPTHFAHLPALRVINAKYKKFDEDRFALDMSIQVTSAIRITKAILPLMAKARYGRCLFMLTNYVLGLPPKNTTAYVVAKSALQGLVKSLAADYASFGITVNAVAPSMITTKFLEDLSPLIVEAAAEAHPMKRNATVQDVTPAMAFLLSDQARFITGVTLPVTGGSNI